jgi:hypothetical protein
MSEDILALFIPIIAIFMSLLIPIVYAVYDYKRRRDIVEATHKERLAAIERGMEIPALPESFYLPLKVQRRPRYLLWGLIWTFVGSGLFAALYFVADEEVAWFATIPVGIGLAYLIYYAVEARKEQESRKEPVSISQA